MSDPRVTSYQVLVVKEETYIRRLRSWRDASGLHVDVRRVVPGRSGICQRCGCSGWDACPGGCSWVDSERTICSRCLMPMLTRIIRQLVRR